MSSVIVKKITTNISLSKDKSFPINVKKHVFNIKVQTGARGLSAYEVRLADGNVGTIDDYLAFLSDNQQRASKTR